MDSETFRIIDANLNRVTEGLRVIEDVYRYALDDAVIQQRLKALRHRIASEVDTGRYIRYRDSLQDVGFATVGRLENKRESLQDLVRSNMKRVQEGLRVLEETMKLESSALSITMKQLRYESYEIEKIMDLAVLKKIRKGLYLILTGPSLGFERMTEMAVAGGLPAVQLRYKGQSEREFLSLAHAMRDITRGSRTKLIINDRVDIALMAGADGVHLGQGDLPAQEARAVMGSAMIIGLSTHTMSQVEEAQKEPIDYIGFGPVFQPFSKPDHDPVVGIEMLRKAVETSRLPVTAIGGINRERLKDLQGIGFRNVACIGAIESTTDPAAEMRAIQEMTGEKS